jgi:hypothetical protein
MEHQHTLNTIYSSISRIIGPITTQTCSIINHIDAELPESFLTRLNDICHIKPVATTHQPPSLSQIIRLIVDNILNQNEETKRAPETSHIQPIHQQPIHQQPIIRPITPLATPLATAPTTYRSLFTNETKVNNEQPLMQTAFDSILNRSNATPLNILSRNDDNTRSNRDHQRLYSTEERKSALQSISTPELSPQRIPVIDDETEPPLRFNPNNTAHREIHIYDDANEPQNWVSSMPAGWDDIPQSRLNDDIQQSNDNESRPRSTRRRELTHDEIKNMARSVYVVLTTTNVKAPDFTKTTSSGQKKIKNFVNNITKKWLNTGAQIRAFINELNELQRT